jgi:hypothetical protein
MKQGGNSCLLGVNIATEIFRLFIIFKSTFVHNETVYGIRNVVDINSLLYGVVLFSEIVITDIVYCRR